MRVCQAPTTFKLSFANVDKYLDNRKIAIYSLGSLTPMEWTHLKDSARVSPGFLVGDRAGTPRTQSLSHADSASTRERPSQKSAWP